MQQTLSVLPNPYTFIDGDGEPQGACPADPEHAAGKRMWVGAKLDPARTRVDREADRRLRGERPWKGDSRPAPQTTKFVFSTGPVEIPLTSNYLDRIRTGDLIPADEETHRRAFGGATAFILPAERLLQERAKAAANYQATHGTQAPWVVDEQHGDVQ